MTAERASSNLHAAKLLSPFRYPGGKTWLIPYIYQWFNEMDNKPTMYIEPFAGGSIVGLNVAYRKLVDHVFLVELDQDVAAVWHTILYGDAAALVERITSFEMSRQAVQKMVATSPENLEDRALQTIVRNRVSRAGILASGAGILKNGENGRGVKSRWYPETLKKRILQINEMRQRITFVEGDGLAILKLYTWPVVFSNLVWLISKAFPFALGTLGPRPHSNVVFFIDPPYTVGSKKAGKRLYRHHELDHEKLFRIASKLKGDFLMTYSCDAAVCDLAQQHNLDFEQIPMRSSHHTETFELLIGRDLDWARRFHTEA